MKIFLLNPPHTAIGSRIPVEHLPPLGLLYIGGALLDIGLSDVKLLDADYSNMSLAEMVELIVTYKTEVLLIGHSGSSSAHPTVIQIADAVKSVSPDIQIIYGGVYPSYHAYKILQHEPSIDFIVRGEGETIIQNLIHAMVNNQDYHEVQGIAYRDQREVKITPNAPLIQNLEEYRIGWELIDLSDYSYWGKKRAVVVQFSRGCPHKCSYCGQQLFWQKWRHRDPQQFADEIEWLHKEHQVEVFNLADENPTASQPAWRAFLEALIAKNLDIIIVGSTRTGDIVRDEFILPLYKKAGVARFLLGIENYDANTLKKIRKGTSVEIDQKAIQLLRQHHILSMATYVFGFEEETIQDYWGGLKKILRYDPDQVQMLYATPHHWTDYFSEVKYRQVIQPDLRKWDYKHQVMKVKKVSPFTLMLSIKLMEIILQLRPKAIRRLLFHPDAKIREAIKWYYQIGRKVWFYEIYHFLFTDKRVNKGKTVETFWQYNNTRSK